MEISISDIWLCKQNIHNLENKIEVNITIIKTGQIIKKVLLIKNFKNVDKLGTSFEGFSYVKVILKL
jgi:hypothetical protein